MAELSSVVTFKWGGTTATHSVNVTSVGAGFGREMLDVTEIDDTGPDFIAGLLDAGEITLELNFDPDTTIHGTLMTDLLAGTNKAWYLPIAGTGTKTFSGTGLIRSLSPAIRAKQQITATVAIRTTGPWAYA